ncbi:hypothetical protein CNBG_9426 [Cryptococcus deuterogattii R265]|uniref:uncharacterized protein n=1 Tax=Cryptococcus deuterogattii (strain R265) TaxID=294750 RepID=UPI001936E5BE|nr:hypothetical protein CNBG_9426 [Cryptococcus deuterogattii R265]
MAFAKSRRWSGDAWSLWQDSKMEARAIKNGNVRIEAEERNSAKGFMISRRSQLSSIYYYQGSINSKATKML